MINSIDDGIVVLDAERNIIAANDAFLLRASNSREQVLGCCCYEFGPGACTCPIAPLSPAWPRARARCGSASANGQGQLAWEEIHASPILDARAG